MADGWITIGTKIDNDKFDKQLRDIDKKIANEEKNTKLKLEAKIEAENELKRQQELVFQLEKQYAKAAEQAEKLQNIMSKKQQGVSLTPQEFMDLSGYEEVIKNEEKIGSQLDKMYDKQSKLNNSVKKTTQAYENSKNKVSELKDKAESINLKKQQKQVENFQKNMANVGKNTGNAIKSIGRLAIGVLSVASAYSLLKSASSTLGQYDEQYATNLEYIRYLLAETLAPALKYLVNLAGTLLSYLNYILNAWFGITLFSKNSAKNFSNAQKSTSKMKQDLQTAGFDEMQILSDTSTSDGGGGVAPSIDPTSIQGEIPEWLQWIVDNKDLILSVMAGIVVALGAWKLGLDAITSLGIGIMIAGVIKTVQSLLDYLEDPSWENFGKIIQGIGIFVIGLGVAFLGLPGIITGVAILILGIIVQYWNEIKSFLQKGIDWLSSKSDWVHEMFGDTIGEIYDTVVANIQLVLDWFDSLFKNVKIIFDNIVQFIQNVFAGNWKAAWENVKNIFAAIWEHMVKTANTFFGMIWNNAKAIVVTIGNGIVNIFKSVVNAVLWTIEQVLNGPIRTVNGLVGIINKLPGVSMPYLSEFHLPRLKVGGIINMPGRGVPVGGQAIGGEAGREGVIPLTDSQAMETLGETIGRYITINANIVNTMNGRVISRQLQQVKNSSDFAYNT